MNRSLCGFFAVFACVALLWGCGKAKPSFLQVQICVEDKNGMTTLLDELKMIGATRQMRFIDSSGRTSRNLETIGYAGTERADGSPFIYVGIRSKDGMGLDAGNLGLPGYQVALGFSEGSDALESRRFADAVIQRLKQHWPIEMVPLGTGALPKPGCR